MDRFIFFFYFDFYSIILIIITGLYDFNKYIFTELRFYKGSNAPLMALWELDLVKHFSRRTFTEANIEIMSSL